jgi:BolA protein
LEETFHPSQLELEDESHLHAGHGAVGGHFRVRIVSEKFTGHSLVQRHRMVYEALKNLMGSEIHAIGIQALTPDEIS